MSDIETKAVFAEEWIRGRGGLQFYTRTYAASGAPRALIVFVHGFAEHAARHENTHSAWAARGFTVFTYDQRGFGRTAVDAGHRSKGAAYGKTSYGDLLQDLELWVRRLHGEHPGLPLFLFGHSMGGALVLFFLTREKAPPAPDTLEMVSGVVASSPMFLQTNPVPRLLRHVGGILATPFPYLVIPAVVPIEDLTRDPATREATAKDRLYFKTGSLRGLSDMFNVGEQLLWADWKNFPKRLPVLFVHGTSDKVTSFKATEEFFKNLDAEDKKLILYPGGYHELRFEPDGVKEKLIEDCGSWLEEHLPGAVPASRL